MDLRRPIFAALDAAEAADLLRAYHEKAKRELDRRIDRLLLSPWRAG